MKPVLLKLPNETMHSFNVRQDLLPNVNNRWHYHSELELILFHRGSGTQFIGDSVRGFNAGDIVLIGTNLPHFWQFDESCNCNAAERIPFCTVIHFSGNFLGERFFNIPESKSCRGAIEKARRGISVKGYLNEDIRETITKICSSEGIDRVLLLIQCLDKIGSSPDVDLLSSLGFLPGTPKVENDRINLVYDYTLRHFKKRIMLSEVAAEVNMTSNSFCRYFKSRTGKSFIEFLSRVRIGYACKLLIDNRLSSKQICFESGFNNTSSFHQSFKEITGMTPASYQKKYIESDV